MAGREKIWDRLKITRSQLRVPLDILEYGEGAIWVSTIPGIWRFQKDGRSAPGMEDALSMGSANLPGCLQATTQYPILVNFDYLYFSSVFGGAWRGPRTENAGR